MFAVLLNLPKWLLAMIAIGILGGHIQQLECKMVSCGPDAVQSECGDAGGGGSSSAKDNSDCSCQCHFLPLISFEAAPFCTLAPLVQKAVLAEVSDYAPDSPCADIDHPPQLA